MIFGLIEILISVLLLLIGVYYYLTWNYNFWTSKGINGPQPEILFGNIKDLAIGKCSFSIWIKELYEEYRDEPMFGIYMRGDPTLIVNDMELIKTILIKDFNSFSERPLKPDIHDPLSVHLVALDTERWKALRPKLSPAFTPGKVREMFYLINECGDRLQKYLNKVDGQCVDMHEVAARFAIDVVCHCVFGVDGDALENKDSIFRKIGKKAVACNDWRLLLKMRMMAFAPALYKLFGGLLADKTLPNFFINLTRDTIKYREENNVMKHDFVDILRALRKDPSKVDGIEMTDWMMAAQFFVFFLTGFESSSAAISNCMYELAMNHEIQDKLRKEIRSELAKTNGTITYEGIQEMKYLDKVVKEILRKYPPAPTISRIATSSYTFSKTNMTIPAKTRVYIPVYGIQHDPRFFPEPETFNPENFSEEAMNRRPPLSFLTFGDGPRNCIGECFGRMQAKLGLVKILQNYSVDVCEKTDKEYKIDVRSYFLVPENGIIVKIAKFTSN